MSFANCFGSITRGAALCSVLALTACGVDETTTNSSESGTVKVTLTDGAACGFDNVYVTVSKVRLHPNADASPTGPGWSEFTVATTLGRIDLLSLINGKYQQLGQAALPTGTYQQIRLVLAANSGGAYANAAVPTGGTELALDVGNAAQNGIGITGPVTIKKDTTTEVALDFDACRSIVRSSTGAVSLRPVVTAIQVADSGFIEGVVKAAPGARVYAEREGKIVKSTVADLNGSFVLAPIAQLKSEDTVDVVVVPTADNGRATGVIRSVPVTANTTTVIGTLGSPISLLSSGARTVKGTVSPASAQASLHALQTIDGIQYEIASTNAASDTGQYAFDSTMQLTLPAGTPSFGKYQTMLPIPLSPSTSAGVYSITATTSTGTNSTKTANIQQSDVTNLNFSF